MGIINETAFLKKGTHSAGVARQYSGTVGRVENCQVGVFLAYAGARGYTLLDAELYLPKGWTDEPARLQAVGLTPDTPFATKPQLAQRLLARAQAAGVSLAWVVGDTVYGHSGSCAPGWRRVTRPTCWRCRRTKTSWSAGTRWGGGVCRPGRGGLAAAQCRARQQGRTLVRWQCLVLADADKGYYLLFRRACAQPEQWQAYLVWGPQTCDVPTLVRIAGSRWRIESAFEMAKQEVGLDKYEVRNARGWDRHVILALWALALLSVVRAACLPPPDPQKKSADLEQVLVWSHWCQCHQGVALHCHCRRQQATTCELPLQY